MYFALLQFVAVELVALAAAVAVVHSESEKVAAGLTVVAASAVALVESAAGPAAAVAVPVVALRLIVVAELATAAWLEFLFALGFVFHSLFTKIILQHRKNQNNCYSLGNHSRRERKCPNLISQPTMRPQT